ncbi:phage tail fiber protein [Sporohalobacter salinus]|uniref:phage tail fiber protein n=1 Tax=Sporohalobacter salinus TaxID=1494606 RepID=UPI0019605824|nr:hypothetical protein [Sporohalobacter salinus]MBM7623715.1 hypothetical protein [Sporohalobacter salinus]
MAGNLTNIGEKLALNLLFRNTGTPPTDIYLGLATGKIEDSDDLSTITEEDDQAYSRQKVTFTAPGNNGEGATEIINNEAIKFGPWDADADNDITYAFFVDDQDRLLTWFKLPQPKAPTSGEPMEVPLNELIFDID